jgi:small GTP-binding protein
METPQYNYINKIVIVGNANVGKTEFINQWCKKNFDKKYIPTIGVEFASKLISYDNKIAKLQIWDTAGQETLRQIIRSYYRGAHLILLFVAANESKEVKISQIRELLELIPFENRSAAKIALIESKIDLPNATLLSSSDLEPLNFQFAFHESFSAIDDTYSEQINKSLRLVLPLINPELVIESIENKQIPLASRELYANTKTNINILSDQHVNMLLTSLRNLLIHGPVNEQNKSYAILFGGKEYTLNENKTIKVPEHVISWINTIDIATPDTKKTTLLRLYDDLIEVSQQKSFLRSSSTKIFYEKSLPGFIEHCVKKSDDNVMEYFVIRHALLNISTHRIATAINDICETLIEHLETGALKSKLKPYDVTFFGSKKHQLQDHVPQVSIAVPNHVASLLNYLINDPTSTLLKVLFALDFSIAMKFSICSSREATTQEFYNNLPTFIAKTIFDKIRKLNEVNDTSHSSQTI